MEIEYHCGLQPIHFICRPSTMKKGEQLYNAGHVIKLIELKEGNQIKGFVIRQTSVSLKPYEVLLELNKKREVVKADCACVAGIISKCKHIAAVVIATNKEETSSKTNQPCEWMKPHSSKVGQQKYAKGKQFSELFPLLPGTGRIFTIPQSNPANELLNLNNINCTLSIMLKAENTIMCQDIVKETIDLSVSKSNESSNLPSTTTTEHMEIDSINDSNIQEMYKQQISSLILTELSTYPFNVEGDCCIKTFNTFIFSPNVEKLTNDTSKDKVMWKSERRFRITASRAYEIYTYSKTNWKEKSKKYFESREFSTVYTRHGIYYENIARHCYSRDRNCEVFETGLVVCASDQWLAVSPDGIIFNSDKTPHKLLEIKCPYKGKFMSANDIVDHTTYLIKSDNGISIKRKRKYFMQVQLCMCVLNVKKCDFVVFCSYDQSYLIIETSLDENYCSNILQKLKENYFNYMLHSLCIK